MSQKNAATRAEHSDNLATEGYESEIKEEIDGHIQILNTWPTEHQLNYFSLDPVSFAEMADSTLGGRTASCGSSLWSSSDGVHLSSGGYRHLAKAISGINDRLYQEEEGDDAGSVASGISDSVKQVRLDSVVTRPTDRRPLGRMWPHKPADWPRGAGHFGH
jgi:hypothetical protein